MEDEDICTIPLDDPVELERHELEANPEPPYINDTEVLNVPDYCEYSSAQMIEDLPKDIVLDSEEEEAEIVGCGSSSKKMEETTNKWKSNTLVYRRRRSKNVGEHSSFRPLDSARKTITEEHCEAEKHGPVSYHASDIGISKLEEEILHYPNKIADKDNKSWECSENMTRRNLAVDVANADRFPSSHCETDHGEKDVLTLIRQNKFEIVSKTDPQEPGEPSHMSALDFVDFFLSVSNLNVSKNQKIDGGGLDLMKSPPASSAKGALTLARRANLAAKPRELKIFDWDEKEITECHSVKVSDEEFDMGSLRQSPEKEKDGSETQITDTFDVGYDTQMAAEAMEALIYAPPPNTRAQYTNEVPKTEICNFTEDAPKSKESQNYTNPKMTGLVSRINKKQLKNMNPPSTKLNGDISCPLKTLSECKKEYKSQFQLKNDVACREPLAAKSLNCRRPLIVKKVICGRSVRLVGQQKVEENLEEENSGGGSDNRSSSKFTQSTPRGEDRIVQKLRKSSSSTKRNKSKPSERFSEVSKDPESSSKRSMSNNLELAVLKKRRMSSSDVNIHKTFVRKFLKSSSNRFLGIMSSKETQQGRSISGLFGTSIASKLDPWCYTKQKRTHKGVPRHSQGSTNSFTLLTVADDEHKDKYPLKPPKWMGGPWPFTQTECHSFPATKPSGKVSKQMVEGKSMSGVYKCGSATRSEQILPTNHDRGKSSNHSIKPDIMVPTENIKLDAVPADTDASQTSKSNEEFSGPCTKLHSSSLLLKELTRLGYTESLPNFIPRELRRGRNEKISVLFSQHLESNILNQQKKIIARLGFSVASCCSDATHFVTDRFVRTRNMLEAISLGKPVVTHCWLESCDQANCFVDEKCYMLRDAKKEKEIGFSMPVALACASKYPLLMGRRVFITANVKPCIELIQSLVKSVHGKVVKRIPNAEWDDGCIPNDLIILSCNEDYAACVALLQKGAAIYDSELLLNGIVIQKLEFERHQLFTNYAQSNCSSKRPRKK